MEAILSMLASEQQRVTSDFEVTILLSTGALVTGTLESTADGVVSLRRTRDTWGSEIESADIPRHYSIAAVIGAWYTEGS